MQKRELSARGTRSAPASEPPLLGWLSEHEHVAVRIDDLEFDLPVELAGRRTGDRHARRA